MIYLSINIFFFIICIKDKKINFFKLGIISLLLYKQFNLALSERNFCFTWNLFFKKIIGFTNKYKIK